MGWRAASPFLISALLRGDSVQSSQGAHGSTAGNVPMPRAPGLGGGFPPAGEEGRGGNRDPPSSALALSPELFPRYAWGRVCSRNGFVHKVLLARGQWDVPDVPDVPLPSACHS